MSGKTAGKQTTGEEGRIAALPRLYPGTQVTLDDREVITVKPWSARAIVQEIPVLIGRLFAALIPLQGLAAADAAWLVSNIPTALEQAAGELWALIRASMQWDETRLETLTARDLVVVAEAIFAANQGFFAGLTALRARLAVAQTRTTDGAASPFGSSGPGSASPS